jgi:ubiquinone/menaquinone biosynthesis C-methylase UbiE
MKDKNFKLTPRLYDLQTNWPKRLEAESPFFIKLFNEIKPESLADIGCGTAHHAQFFSKHVKEIYAMDPDKDMISYAEENVVKAENVKLSAGGFKELAKTDKASFDMITCLGNTISLLESRKRVKEALKITKNKLSRDGLAVYQFLNFERKMLEKNKFYTPKIIKDGSDIYISHRHFEYGKLKTTADFLITILNEKHELQTFEVNSSQMVTLKINIFLKMAKNSGFKKIRLIGNNFTDEFDKKKHISLYALMSR